MTKMLYNTLKIIYKIRQNLQCKCVKIILRGGGLYLVKTYVTYNDLYYKFRYVYSKINNYCEIARITKEKAEDKKEY